MLEVLVLSRHVTCVGDEVIMLRGLVDVMDDAAAWRGMQAAIPRVYMTPSTAAKRLGEVARNGPKDLCVLALTVAYGYEPAHFYATRAVSTAYNTLGCGCVMTTYVS